MQIPKIIHQIWLGRTVVPDLFYKYSLTWKQYNPDWTINLWTEDNLDTLLYFNLEDFDKLSNFSEKSDYLRFCIILERGGVYVDMDFECLQSIEPLIKKTVLFAGYESADSNIINSAIFGAIINHPLIKEIFLSFSTRINNYHGTDSAEKIGPHYVTPFFLKFSGSKSIFESNIFFPISGYVYWEGLIIDRSELVKSGSYGIHHWSSSWQHPLSRLRYKIPPNSRIHFIYLMILALLKKLKKIVKKIL